MLALRKAGYRCSAIVGVLFVLTNPGCSVYIARGSVVDECGGGKYEPQQQLRRVAALSSIDATDKRRPKQSSGNDVTS